MSLQSCSSDDDYPTVDGKAPTLTLSSAQLKTEPGRDFTITGVAKDADGIKSIRLVNEGLDLDKTIDLLESHPDSLLHEYDLSYAYKGNKDWKGTESFPVEITVEDVGGRTTTNIDGIYRRRFYKPCIYNCSIFTINSAASKS